MRIPTDEEKALGDMLFRILIELNVLSKQSTPTGPELILAALDYLKSEEKVLPL